MGTNVYILSHEQGGYVLSVHTTLVQARKAARAAAKKRGYHTVTGDPNQWGCGYSYLEVQRHRLESR